MKFINLQDKRDIKYLGGYISVWQRLFVKKIETSFIIYQKGYQPLDTRLEKSSESGKFKLKLLKKGLLLINQDSSLAIGIHQQDIKQIILEAFRVFVFQNESRQESVAGNLKISVDKTDVRFFIQAGKVREVVNFFSQDYLKRFFEYRLDDSPPIDNPGMKMVEVLNKFKNK